MTKAGKCSCSPAFLSLVPLSLSTSLLPPILTATHTPVAYYYLIQFSHNHSVSKSSTKPLVSISVPYYQCCLTHNGPTYPSAFSKPSFYILIPSISSPSSYFPHKSIIAWLPTFSLSSSKDVCEEGNWWVMETDEWWLCSIIDRKWIFYLATTGFSLQRLIKLCQIRQKLFCIFVHSSWRSHYIK